ncbi:tRNA nucleotidyltransferase [Candidatus Kinetoplastidibacterium crithidiae]|uniref:CCA-adding tRNA nucleotidyltransferase n=1 Tax=Candidatus Kinetoplastidibacterium crithidiae TCC036E TaxID=1208918 RepID=M1LXM4_9PROT|nr:tRNA nucleotidyltransferase [Candidatus Kinetoplastibacterium crithidii]AFZ82955.1 tRNA nucleotidyltransferase [Candidatus Kinetoplastibacterium crithidii (ex Angomonas deanei ATCC 30255)]AGF47954.1 CCA-adding tRNA nucleotidyltransferase [Candidatus Kinetoplastibacterium crithidii TCC036E]
MFDIKEDSFTKGLKFYIVGGAVRDKLLGLHQQEDRDWVVVGSSPEEMENRGFKKVGKNFPVFLHPITKEEYALARTEYKIAIGHQGFEFNVGSYITLKDDLFRRDLTINAIAYDCINREIIDPFNGLRDIRCGILRHVSSSFREDPLRLIRLARFSAKFDKFSIAKDTMDFCKIMTKNGELISLSKERIWKEISKGLMTKTPINMFNFLKQVEALDLIMPELILSSRVNNFLKNIPDEIDLYTRYAFLCMDTVDRSLLSRRLAVQSMCKNYADLLPYILKILENNTSLSEKFLILEKCDAFRRYDRFIDLLKSCELILKIDVHDILSRLENVLNINLGDYLIESDQRKRKDLVRKARLLVFQSGN